MNSTRLQSARSARLVAGGRALLALALSASILMDTSSRALSTSVRTLIMGYAVYAIALLAVIRRRGAADALQRFASVWLAIDAALFAALIYLTGGADSPLFSPLVFLTLSGTLQWGSRGALGIGLLTGAIFFASAAATFEWNHADNSGVLFVIRSGYLAVTALLLWAFARHIERVVDELSRLSSPVPDAKEVTAPPITQALAHALAVFGCARGTVLWADEDEPQLLILHNRIGESLREETLPISPEALMGLAVGQPAFLANRDGEVLVRSGTRTVQAPSIKWPVPLLAYLAFDRALVIRARAEGCEAWVILTDHPDPANEELAIGGLVAAQLAVSLDRWRAQAARRELAAGEERLRLARDLHDGVLQFMAGTGLQLEALARSSGLEAAARERLLALRTALEDEQLELRGLIGNLRPRGRARGEMLLLREEMTLLAGRLSRAWSVEVPVAVEPINMRLPASLCFDLTRLVREAVANAARHGKARIVSVAVRQQHAGISLQIQDDGHGFPSHGRWTEQEMAARNIGPRSIRERTLALAGELEVESCPTGVAVFARLPAKVAL